MTEREMKIIGDHFETLSYWFLGLFAKYPNEIAELAKNERIARVVRDIQPLSTR